MHCVFVVYFSLDRTFECFLAFVQFLTRYDDDWRLGKYLHLFILFFFYFITLAFNYSRYYQFVVIFLVIVFGGTRVTSLSHFAVLVWVFRVHRCSPDESRKENEFCRCCLVVTGPVSLLLLGLFLCLCRCAASAVKLTGKQQHTHTHTNTGSQAASAPSLCQLIDTKKMKWKFKAETRDATRRDWKLRCFFDEQTRSARFGDGNF